MSTPPRRGIAGVAMRTPLINSPVLDARLGARVFLKAETLAAHRLVQVPRRLQQDFLDPAGQARRRRGGLFVRQSRAGRGAAAKLLGMPATIVMPSDAPKAKRERTAALGAEVVLYDRDTEDRAAIARDDRAEARRDAGAAVRRSVDHRRAGHGRAARSSRIWPRSA